MNCPKYILDILKTLNSNGFEAYVVGGCVRDYLLKIPCHDYDITTNAKPEDILSLFKKCIPTGIKHGTITVISDTPVEITTFRTESEYTDHRHPDKVKFVDTIEEDLARRDFTVNAMAYNPLTGIIDPFNGKEDLKNKIIRAVGNPDKRFQEDALRMMRAHRFCAKLHFTMEEETRAAISRNKDLLQCISVERIRDELTRILQCNAFEVENMVDLLEPWIPELKTSLHCEQVSPWHDFNVLHHGLYAIDSLHFFDETLAYTLLFHDLGKPETKTTDATGRDHFEGHPLASKKIAMRVCKAFKMSSYHQKTIPDLVEYHDEWFEDGMGTVYKFRIELGWDDAKVKQLLEVRRCDLMAHSEKGQYTLYELHEFMNIYQNAKVTVPLSTKDLLINGNDIIEYTNIRGGDIKEALNRCLRYCFYHPEKNVKRLLIEYLNNAS